MSAYMKDRKALIIYLLSGLFLLLDRWLKWQALHAWATPKLINRFLGWDPFFNPGVAFSLPVPWWATSVFTVPVLAVIAYALVRSVSRIAYRVPEQHDMRYAIRDTGLAFIFTGALSNLIDRLLYHVTVDYFLILTAVINVADVLIVVGFVMYSMSRKK